MENSKNKISISMIVRNEESCLATCLESVKGADEIVIVDTGSVDRTIDIAKQYTQNIYNLEWNDDFASARNLAKSKCTGDWILSIDADEVLEKGGIEKIRAFIDSCPDHAVGVKMKSTNSEFFMPRLFRNIPSTVFLGRIHEALNIRNLTNADVTIEWGSSEGHKFDPDRNLRILEKAIIDEPLNTRYLFYLGREYGYKSDWKRTIQTLERYVSISTWLTEKADAYFMLGLAYWYSHEGEKARQACFSAMNINANFKAPILLMAHMSFPKNAEQWKKMAETATNEDVLFVRDNFLII